MLVLRHKSITLSEEEQPSSHQTQRRKQLLHKNEQRFRGGLVFEAHKLRVSLNSRLESNTEEAETQRRDPGTELGTDGRRLGFGV